MRTHFFKDLPCGTHFRNVPFIRANDAHDDGELNRLCSIIYAPDERTGLPSSDLAVMLTDKVNPQIKDWIQKQLMSPISVDEPNSSINGQQVDDDTLLQLVRGSSESTAQYVSRVNDFIRSLNTKADA